MIEIKVRLFGTFRKYKVEGESILLNSKEPITVSGLKKLLEARFKEVIPNFSDSQLIEDSAIADESQVLSLHHVIQSSCTLLILPPVCGG